MTAEATGAVGPLAGVRVLDLTTTMSGPFCTLLLAQLGAEVDKIEAPAGDVVRQLTPGRSPGMSPIFLCLNQGKRSIVLDLSVEQDRQAFQAALSGYDVIVHNMRTRAAARIGLTQEALDDLGARVLLCELVGFGPGPYEDLPAYDDTIQAFSGLAWVQGNGGRPEYVRTAMADKVSGLYAALGICAALASRGGEPVRTVRLPMFETIASFTALEQLGGLAFEPATGPALYPRTASPHRRPFATEDGYLSLMLYTDRHWAAFFRYIGRPELVEDPRFATVSGRTAHIDEAYSLIAEAIAQKTTKQWLDALSEIDVPHAPVLSIDDVLHDPHVRASGLFPVTHHPTEGWVRTPRAPFIIDGHPLAAVSPAELLGQHTAQFLAELDAGPACSSFNPKGGH